MKLGQTSLVQLLSLSLVGLAVVSAADNDEGASSSIQFPVPESTIAVSEWEALFDELHRPPREGVRPESIDEIIRDLLRIENDLRTMGLTDRIMPRLTRLNQYNIGQLGIEVERSTDAIVDMADRLATCQAHNLEQTRPLVERIIPLENMKILIDRLYEVCWESLLAKLNTEMSEADEHALHFLEPLMVTIERSVNSVHFLGSGRVDEQVEEAANLARVNMDSHQFSDGKKPETVTKEEFSAKFNELVKKHCAKIHEKTDETRKAIEFYQRHLPLAEFSGEAEYSDTANNIKKAKACHLIATRDDILEKTFEAWKKEVDAFDGFYREETGDNSPALDSTREEAAP